MSGKRAKALKKQARKNASDGSVASGPEYKRLKKLYVHPTYAPCIRRRVVDTPTRRKSRFKRAVKL